MSGIYIPGMGMPKGCAFCKISRRNGKKMICPFRKREWDIHDPMSADHRLDDCPLVLVPEHGRIIDADALCKRLRSLAENEYTPEVFANWIENHIDTIIPADKEGEG